MSRGDVELGSLLSFLGGGCGHELGAHCQHSKRQSHQCTVNSILFLLGKRPKMLIVGVERLSVYHGINWIDTLKVPLQQNIRLQFLRQDRYCLW
jgi:hypothetical protein